MKILVIGSGGREHALCWKLAQSSRVTKLYCAPGNAGIALVRCKNDTPVELVDLKSENMEGILRFARRERPDLVVIGPEGPLCAGLVEKLDMDLNIKAFGPEKRGAELESSKIFTKSLLRKHGIPTADFSAFTDAEKAITYIHEHGCPLVIKADGLAAGKGVLMAETIEEAEVAVRRCMIDGEFGEAGRKIVIEETLRGEEASIMALTDGTTLLVLPSAQDHKRIGDNDTGPNTGGMGAYSPAPVVTPEIESRIVREILVPTLHALRREDRPYKGVLYAGIMLTDSGPKVLEYNVRFGDPETQCILPRVKSDLVDLMEHVLSGTLDQCSLDISDDAAVCVVMAAKGYPGAVVNGAEIKGLDDFGQVHGAEDVNVFHAGTGLTKDGRVVTHGGRVLGVTATAATLPLAVSRAYQAVEQISFDGAQFRRDIAGRALRKQR
ncbi:MAG TPA: phosphoribosylamine--glycine ligase [Planctomycetota bacterium]